MPTETIAEPKTQTATPAAPVAPSGDTKTVATPAAPATPEPSPPASSDDNPYAELDVAFTRHGIPPEPSKDDKAAPKPAGKPADKAAPAPSTPPKGPPMPKELRTELERVKGELKTKTEAFTALETKIAEYEAKGKDVSALTARLSALEKQMEEKDSQIRALKQEASPEFKKKWDEPFSRLAARAQGVVEKIVIEDSETGTTRNATWGEFTKVYGLDEFTALRESKRIFGDDGAQIAMGYYRQLHELDDARRIALDEERKQWKEKDAADQAKQIQSREEIQKAWRKINDELTEKQQDYSDNPEDKELVEARAKAYALYDAPVKSLRDRMLKDAHNRQRVAAFPVLKIKLARVEQERDDLKAELDGLREKPPGGTKRSGGTPAVKPEEDFETGLRRHMQAG